MVSIAYCDSCFNGVSNDIPFVRKVPDYMSVSESVKILENEGMTNITPFETEQMEPVTWEKVFERQVQLLQSAG